ncbi:hypothetical protein C8F01DRAFT_320882 [Mycena amicta]|nr:hypothetical protein C8F01DRAFT_320882 [Mycena amicta]
MAPLHPSTSLWSRTLALPKRRNFISLPLPGSSTGSLSTPLSSILSMCRFPLCRLLFVVFRWTRVLSFHRTSLSLPPRGFPWVFKLALLCSTLERLGSMFAIFHPLKVHGPRLPVHRLSSTNMPPPPVGSQPLLDLATYTSARFSTCTNAIICCIPTRLYRPTRVSIFGFAFRKKGRRFNLPVRESFANAPTITLSASRRS